MKILVLESSGRRKGSSNLLAAEFIRGARQNGHEVAEYDVFHANIRPCTGCGACEMAGACVQKDDYETQLKDMIKETDLLAFVMPVYYYNWPAQLKTVIDRFYSYTDELTSMRKKTVLLAAAWDDTDTVYEVVRTYYERICAYMQFRDQGMVLGRSCGTPAMTCSSIYPQKAYELGRSLH